MPYHPMSDAEWRAFVDATARPAVLSTVRAGGRPHATPVWIALDGDDIVFTTGAETVKGRNIARTGRVTLVVQDDRPPFSFVTIDGTATLSDDLDDVRAWAAHLGGRYMGPDHADAYGERNGVPGELLVRVTPTHVVSARDVAD